MLEKINNIIYKVHANPNPYAGHEFFVQEYPPAADGNWKIGKILFSGSKTECFDYLETLRKQP